LVFAKVQLFGLGVREGRREVTIDCPVLLFEVGAGEHAPARNLRLGLLWYEDPAAIIQAFEVAIGRASERLENNWLGDVRFGPPK
jgi:hypothetical protein